MVIAPPTWHWSPDWEPSVAKRFDFRQRPAGQFERCGPAGHMLVRLKRGDHRDQGKIELLRLMVGDVDRDNGLRHLSHLIQKRRANVALVA